MVYNAGVYFEGDGRIGASHFNATEEKVAAGDEDTVALVL